VARKHRAVTPSGHCILLVDDDTDYLEATSLLLESEGHRILTAASGAEALQLLGQTRVDLVLIDYFMPQMTGEEVVARLREFDKTVQVILQTGYASERPPRDMLRRLDIQGYYDKSEGPEKLLLWADAGLKAAEAIDRLERSRRGLRGILEVSPSLHRIQPLGDLYSDVLAQALKLVGGTAGFLATVPEAAAPANEEAPSLVLAEVGREPTVLCVQVGCGRFSIEGDAQPFSEEVLGQVREGLRARGALEHSAGTVMPMCVGELTLGVLYLDHGRQSRETKDLLQVFANQATVAVQNMVLYEMAALDPLTGVHARRFFENWMRREVRTAFRARQTVSLLMLDMDGLKEINDTAGHLIGDQALSMVGKVLRMATRENDVVGRYGGDEFAVVLPQTDAEGAAHVGHRLVELLAERSVPVPGGPRTLTGSVGIATLLPHEYRTTGLLGPIPARYFQDTATALIERADQALYVAKERGKNRVCSAEPLDWVRPVFE